MLITLCKSNIAKNEKVSIIADYATRPKNADKHLDKELLNLPNIENVQMVDSIRMPLIQLCDLFLGSVIFASKLKKGLVIDSSNSIARKKFIKKLNEVIRGSTSDNFFKIKTTTYKDKYFSVWNLKLREK